MRYATFPPFGGDEREVVLLARSLERQGAVLLIMEAEQARLGAATRRAVDLLGAQVIGFRLPDAALDFPYAQKVFAAAEAESSCRDDLLVWMDPDTLVLQPPQALALPPGRRVGCCPVQLINISAAAGSPPDRFWQAVFTGCGTSEERVFPVTTTVDKLEVWAHFNAGLLVVKPLDGLLGGWRDDFERLFRAEVFQPFYRENQLYRIFIHQAVLVGSLLARLGRDEFHLLPTNYNVPIFLRPRFPGIETDPVTCRYDELAYFDQPGWVEAESRIAAKIQELIGDDLP